MKILAVFDDTIAKSEVIQDVIGSKGFGDVVVKRKHLSDYYKEVVENCFEDVKLLHVHSIYELNDLLTSLPAYELAELQGIIHCFANYFVADIALAKLSLKKLLFINEPFLMQAEGKTIACLFPDIEMYKRFLENATIKTTNELTESIKEHFEADGFIDIGIVANFIQCITGNFDARYFNSLSGNEYTLVKSSTNKKKIKSEYTYYHLLPADMKMWFVMPFDYQENEKYASYTMERLHMTDLAIKWVHGSIDYNEFNNLLDKYFYFFKQRHSKAISKEEYNAIAKGLYVDKVKSRIKELKELPEFAKIQALLQASNVISIDELVKKYFLLKDKIEGKAKYAYVSVIGHGDPCFANTLYNKSTKTLKFIDPKGALSEEELWTNPYYDIAKLSHSVCGRYDYFNNGLFEIKIKEDFSSELCIDFDNREYISLFRKKVEENGFDYWRVRIYEASLFISMLPLHIDYPYKVYGFILNAANILKEIEENV